MFDFDLTRIKALVFDVDGVLSTSTIAMDDEGQPLRTLNVKDGYAIQLAVKRGLVVAIISGGHSPNIRMRYEYLGVRHIFMSSSYKIRDLETLTSQTGIPLDQMLPIGRTLSYIIWSRYNQANLLNLFLERNDPINNIVSVLVITLCFYIVVAVKLNCSKKAK